MRVSTLFQGPTAGPQPQVRRTPPPSIKIEKRFPIGLDVGQSAVKWVQLGMVEGKVTMLQGGALPVNATGEGDRPAVVNQTLRQAAAQFRLGGPAAISLPLEQVSLRLLKLPTLSPDEVQETIRWQLEQTLPAQVRYEDLVMDHVVFEGLGREWESQVLVATADRDRVTSRVAQAEQAGFEVVAVDIDPFALTACLIWQHHVRPEETTLVIHLGTQQAFMLVAAKAQLTFSQPLLVTGHGLTRAVSDVLGVSMDEAEHLKQNYGVRASANAEDSAAVTELREGGDVSAQVARALSSPLENLLVDVLHSFKGFSYQVSQSQVTNFDRVLLTGGASRLPGLVDYVKGRLNVPVELADPTGGIPVLPNLDAQEIATLGQRLGIAVGLALREVTA